MVLRSYSHLDDSLYGNTRLPGLRACRRSILIFVDENALKRGFVTRAKCAIINRCLYDSTNLVNKVLRINDGVAVREAIYFGEVTTPVMGDLANPEAIFSLDNVTTKERVILKNGETVNYDDAVYSARFKNMEAMAIQEAGLEVGGEVVTVPPEFYCDYQMMIKTGDYFDVAFGYDGKTLMKDLFDDCTKITYMKLESFDTIRLHASNYKNALKAEVKGNKAFDIHRSISNAFQGYLGINGVFIYDSLALNKEGKKGAVAVHGGVIPLGKNYSKAYLAENFNQAVTLFELNCRDLENTYGNIRVHFLPDPTGDHFKVRFKDFNESPIVALSQITPNGDVVLTDKKNPISSIDNGFYTDNYVSDTLNASWKAEQESFSKEMQGY